MRVTRFRSAILFGASLLLGSGLGVVALAGSGITSVRGSDGVIELKTKPRPPKARQGSSNARSGVAVLPRSVNSTRSAALAAQFEPYVEEASRLYHIPAALIKAVIQVESGFDPRVVSSANAHGLMQLLPTTAERMLVSDIFDPRQNILGGTRYLRLLANTFNGDIQLTLAAYNAGEGAVTRYSGIPPYAETRDYVVRVLDAYQQYQTVVSGG